MEEIYLGKICAPGPDMISPAGPGRDIVGELEAAVKTDQRMRFGLYYSLFEWFNPLYNNDEKNNFSTSDFVTAKMLPELTELVMKYKVKIPPKFPLI